MPTKPKSILIAEDEKSLAHALTLKLQHEGFEVTAATNGQECLDLIESKHFDIVLLDLMMPTMDGFQVLATLQKKPQMPTVFVLSNLSQHEDEERVLSLGAKKFFVKSDTSLTTIVEEIRKEL